MDSTLEQQFLALLVKNSDFIQKSISRLPETIFSTKAGQWFYNIICEHYLRFGTVLNKTSLSNYLNDSFQEDKEREEEKLYIKSVLAKEPKESDFEFYIDRLINQKYYREVLVELDHLTSNINPQNAIKLVSDFEEKSLKIRPSTATQVIQEFDLSKNVFDRIKDFSDQKENVQGILTPIKDLNDTIGGLKKSHLIVISAPSGSGKSHVLAGFADFANRQKKNVVFVTLEMSYHDIETRFHSMVTNIELKKIMLKTLTDMEKRDFYYRLFKRHVEKEDQKKLKDIFYTSDDLMSLGVIPTLEETNLYGIKAAQKCLDRLFDKIKDLKFSTNQFYILDSPGGINLSRLRSQLKFLSGRFPIDLIVIDYLNLIKTGEKSLQDWEEAKLVSRTLKQIAREFNCPVLTACQLSLKGPTDTISQMDIRYSKAIAENSDFVIAFRRSEKDQLMGIIRLEIIKNRHSEKNTIAVREKFATATIENIIEV